MEKEYIVTLKKGIDPNTFRQDMVADNMLPYVPSKAVTVANERPASIRNTHYMLTDEEATQLQNDPRVDAVELRPDLRDDIIIGDRATQTGNFDKSTSASGDNINWGLRRMSALSNPYNSSGAVVGGYTHTLTGTGVDFIVHDSGIQADHPEFQDSFGNSRVQEIDWYRAQSVVSGTLPTGFYTDYDGHGTHCAGIAAGKTYGWAKNSKIYSIKVAGLQGSSDPNSGMPISDCFDVIKEWHKTKTADVLTGVKRPTVVNMSWGYFSRYLNITGGNYRGTDWSGSSKVTAYGMTGSFDGAGYRHPVRIASVDADLEELIEAGVIVCIAAGNKYHKIDVEGGLDYNNYYSTTFSGNKYYHRGSSPYSSNAIMVGAVDSQLDTDSNEQIAEFSEKGPGVDVYAPGVNIFSATSNTNRFTDGAYGDTAFRIANISGTSMASPQIAGLATTYAEIQPNATPAQHKAWVIANSKEQLDENGNTGTDYTNNRSLQGGTNRYSLQPYNSADVLTIAGDETIVAEAGAVEATYTLTTSTTSVNEGESFTITLTTTGLVNGTIVPYTISGVASNDISDVSLNGSFIIGTSQVITFTATEDNTFDDGDETFVLSLDNVVNKTVSVTIVDSSKPDATYSLASTRTSLGEGESFTITLTASNVLSGTSIPYTITGVSTADISGEPLTGALTVGSDMSRTYVVTADGLLEGTEILNFAAAGQNIDIQINDTSNSPITYNLVANTGAVNEGGTFSVDLVVENGVPGVTLPYIVTGVSATDLSSGSLTGNFVTGSVTQASFTVAEDFTTEGEETFTIALTTIDNVSASVVINDSSTTLVEGEEVVTSTGSGSFTIPSGVTSISVMAVGGGGGAGTTAALGAGQITGGAGAGALGILNNLSVMPGQTLTYTVGAGGAGNNNGGDTSFTYGGQTYTAGGGQTSSAVAINTLSLYQRKAGGAGGTTTGNWTISKAGGAGGDAYRYNQGSAIVGGGGGGAGAGSIGGAGFPYNELLDPDNASTSPYNWTANTTGNIALAVAQYQSGISIQVDVLPGGTENYDAEYGYILAEKIKDFLATTSSFGTYDAYYVLVRNGNDGVPRWVWESAGKDFGTDVVSAQYTPPNATYVFGGSENGNSAIQLTTTYGGTTYSRAGVYNSGESVTIIEFRGGVAENATDLNTTKLGEIKLFAEGNTAGRPQQSAGSGGGHGYVENWQSGTGIVYGASGGGTNLTREITGLRGDNDSTTPTSLTIAGAGAVKVGVAGQIGNNTATVTPSTAGYEVGAGAGGVLVMGLAPSGSQTRANSGQDGGLWIRYPGSRDKFEAPSYTLTQNKTNANEGSTFTIAVTNNLSTTDPQIPIPYEITGVDTNDIDMAGLVTTYGNIRGSFTQVANSKTFTVTSDDTFDGVETFNLKLIEQLTATTQADNDHYLPFMSDNNQDISTTLNDTSDGTQETFAGAVTNSGATGYVWSSGSDRNGLISGTNPFTVFDKGDTINWTINASGHPFYIKDVQGSGTANQTNSVLNQGTVNSTITYSPSVGGRKYYQCSIHNDMNGELYLADKFWANLHHGTAANSSFERADNIFVAHAGSGNSIVIEQVYNPSDAGGANKTCALIKYTNRGSAIWKRTFTQNYLVRSAIVDSQENIYVGYSGSWNWESNVPSADYPSDAYITKLNAAGTVQWQRNYSDNDGHALAIKAMAFASDGNIIAVGAAQLQNFDSGLWIIKVNVTNGDVISVKKVDPSSKKSNGQDVVVDSLGNIYVYGREVVHDDTENAVRLWKFNSSLSLQWQRSYVTDLGSGNYNVWECGGLTLDQNGNPIIGVTHGNSYQAGYNQSHILRISATTSLILNDWIINPQGVTGQPNYILTSPQIKDIDFDTRNNRIIVVGKVEVGTSNTRHKGMIIVFSDDLTYKKVRRLHTETGAQNTETELYSCSLDNTLNPNTRLWIGGSSLAPNAPTTGTGLGGLTASYPINDADSLTGDFVVEDWEITVDATGDVAVAGPTTGGDNLFDTFTQGDTIDDGIVTASGLVNGTTSTSVSSFVRYKMVLDVSNNAEPETQTPTYNLSSSATTINEGQSFVITLDTTNVPNGTNVPYTITGVSSADIGGVSLTGAFTILNNSATVTINVTADNLTD